jgi:hypothetical protein
VSVQADKVRTVYRLIGMAERPIDGLSVEAHVYPAVAPILIDWFGRQTY